MTDCPKTLAASPTSITLDPSNEDTFTVRRLAMSLDLRLDRPLWLAFLPPAACLACFFCCCLHGPTVDSIALMVCLAL
jgi:hypothetical protein